MDFLGGFGVPLVNGGSLDYSIAGIDESTIIADQTAATVQKPALNADISDELASKLRGALRKRKAGDLDAAFDEFDTNGDGFLSRAEFGKGLAKLGLKLAMEEKDQLMARLDRDGNDEVDVDEFIDFVLADEKDGGGEGSTTREGDKKPEKKGAENNKKMKSSAEKSEKDDKKGDKEDRTVDDSIAVDTSKCTISCADEYSSQYSGEYSDEYSYSDDSGDSYYSDEEEGGSKKGRDKSLQKPLQTPEAMARQAAVRSKRERVDTMKLPLKKGMRVVVSRKFKGADRLYKGKVHSISGSGRGSSSSSGSGTRYAIVYEDGHIERGLERSSIIPAITLNDELADQHVAMLGSSIEGPTAGSAAAVGRGGILDEDANVDELAAAGHPFAVGDEVLALSITAAEEKAARLEMKVSGKGLEAVLGGKWRRGEIYGCRPVTRIVTTTVPAPAPVPPPAKQQLKMSTEDKENVDKENQQPAGQNSANPTKTTTLNPTKVPTPAPTPLVTSTASVIVAYEYDVLFDDGSRDATVPAHRMQGGAEQPAMLQQVFARAEAMRWQGLLPGGERSDARTDRTGLLGLLREMDVERTGFVTVKEFRTLLERTLGFQGLGREQVKWMCQPYMMDSSRPTTEEGVKKMRVGSRIHYRAFAKPLADFAAAAAATQEAYDVAMKGGASMEDEEGGGVRSASQAARRAASMRWHRYGGLHQGQHAGEPMWERVADAEAKLLREGDSVLVRRHGSRKYYRGRVVRRVTSSSTAAEVKVLVRLADGEEEEVKVKHLMVATHAMVEEEDDELPAVAKTAGVGKAKAKETKAESDGDKKQDEDGKRQRKGRRSSNTVAAPYTPDTYKAPPPLSYDNEPLLPRLSVPVATSLLLLASFGCLAWAIIALSRVADASEFTGGGELREQVDWLAISSAACSNSSSNGDGYGEDYTMGTVRYDYDGKRIWEWLLVEGSFVLALGLSLFGAACALVKGSTHPSLLADSNYKSRTRTSPMFDDGFSGVSVGDRLPSPERSSNAPLLLTFFSATSKVLMLLQIPFLVWGFAVLPSSSPAFPPAPAPRISNQLPSPLDVVPTADPTRHPSFMPTAAPTIDLAGGERWDASVQWMWSNPIMGKDSEGAKCRTIDHHWTSIALYTGIRGRTECDSGDYFEYDCHGGGMAVGLYHYMEGYAGFRNLEQLKALSRGDKYSLVCGGIDASIGWAIGGPLHGCAYWKDNKQLGASTGTWRGGGLDAKAGVWGYQCKITKVGQWMRNTGPPTVKPTFAPTHAPTDIAVVTLAPTHAVISATADARCEAIYWFGLSSLVAWTTLVVLLLALLTILVLGPLLFSRMNPLVLHKWRGQRVEEDEADALERGDLEWRHGYGHAYGPKTVMIDPSTGRPFADDKLAGSKFKQAREAQVQYERLRRRRLAERWERLRVLWRETTLAVGKWGWRLMLLTFGLLAVGGFFMLLAYDGALGDDTSDDVSCTRDYERADGSIVRLSDEDGEGLLFDWLIAFVILVLASLFATASLSTGLGLGRKRLDPSMALDDELVYYAHDPSSWRRRWLLRLLAILQVGLVVWGTWAQTMQQDDRDWWYDATGVGAAGPERALASSNSSFPSSNSSVPSSDSPTVSPTAMPSASPSASPSFDGLQPTAIPTIDFSLAPTGYPTLYPTNPAPIVIWLPPPTNIPTPSPTFNASYLAVLAEEAKVNLPPGCSARWQLMTVRGYCLWCLLLGWLAIGARAVLVWPLPSLVTNICCRGSIPTDCLPLFAPNSAAAAAGGGRRASSSVSVGVDGHTDAHARHPRYDDLVDGNSTIGRKRASRRQKEAERKLKEQAKLALGRVKDPTDHDGDADDESDGGDHESDHSSGEDSKDSKDSKGRGGRARKGGRTRSLLRSFSGSLSGLGRKGRRSKGKNWGNSERKGDSDSDNSDSGDDRRKKSGKKGRTGDGSDYSSDGSDGSYSGDSGSRSSGSEDRSTDDGEYYSDDSPPPKKKAAKKSAKNEDKGPSEKEAESKGPKRKVWFAADSKRGKAGDAAEKRKSSWRQGGRRM
jgi:hypothetical protein